MYLVHLPPQVQDFTQAELALDLRVVADPNALFYCGAWVATCIALAQYTAYKGAPFSNGFRIGELPLKD